MKWGKYLNEAFKSVVRKKYSNTKLDKGKTLDKIKKYVKLRQYEFNEWIPILRTKDDGEYRPIISPPITDRILLKALADYCSDKLKSHFSKIDDISFAYQKGKGPRDALIKLKDIFHQGDVILRIDIQKYFNNINKEIILDILKKLNLDEYAISLIEKSLSPNLVQNEAYELAMESIRYGIPQGNAVSAVLSNLYLMEFDNLCKAQNLRLIRYADDMLIIVENKEKAYEMLNFINGYLSIKRGLSIHPLSDEGKTSIYILPQKPSLTYLGVKFNGKSLLPSFKCQTILSNKIKSIAQNHNKIKEDRIPEIMICIKQWCGYYAFTDAPKKCLKKLSYRINYNCKKHIGEQWMDVDLVQIFNYYKDKQNRKTLGLFNFRYDKYGEEYNWLKCY